MTSRGCPLLCFLSMYPTILVHSTECLEYRPLSAKQAKQLQLAKLLRGQHQCRLTISLRQALCLLSSCHLHGRLCGYYLKSFHLIGTCFTGDTRLLIVAEAKSCHATLPPSFHGVLMRTYLSIFGYKATTRHPNEPNLSSTRSDN